MARVDRSCVNLSGRSWNVYDSNNNVIGAIEPREFFTYVGYEGSLISIYFLSPSGAKTGCGTGQEPGGGKETGTR